MKRRLAHGMRRAARVLMRWSTKLDPPAAVNYNISVNSAVQASIDHVRHMDKANRFGLRYQ